ncbi:MAG: hypothetical protein QOI76_406 [Frankiales bacterium]|nr:hypothetical protein [Frankiales bacterium]
MLANHRDLTRSEQYAGIVLATCASLGTLGVVSLADGRSTAAWLFQMGPQRVLFATPGVFVFFVFHGLRTRAPKPEEEDDKEPA